MKKVGSFEDDFQIKWQGTNRRKKEEKYGALCLIILFLSTLAVYETSVVVENTNLSVTVSFTVIMLFFQAKTHDGITVKFTVTLLFFFFQYLYLFIYGKEANSVLCTSNV